MILTILDLTGDARPYSPTALNRNDVLVLIGVARGTRVVIGQIDSSPRLCNGSGTLVAAVRFFFV